MSAVSSFYGEFGLDIDKFVKAVRDIQREAKSIETSLKPLKIAAEDLGKAFAASGAAITATLGLMVHSAADYGEALNKASIQTGIATEKLSALKYIAEQEETTFETLSKGLKAMATQANSNGEAFAALGIKVTDSQGRLRPMDSLVQDVANRLARMEDGTRKNTLASEVFGGKLGQELIPTLNRLGREGLDPALKKVDELGLKLSKEAAMAADEFNDSITDIKAAILGFSNTVATALIPGLTDTTHGMRDAIIVAKDFAKENETLVKAIGLVGVGLTGAGGLLLGLAGFVSIYPKVVTGLVAIKTSLAAMSAETVIATAGIAALIAIYLKMDSEAADVTKRQQEKSEQQHKGIERAFQDLKNLGAIGVTLEQGNDTWLQFEERIRVAIQLNAIELGELKKRAAEAAEGDIRSKAEILAAAKKNKEALTSFDKDIAESARMVARINDGVFRAGMDAEADAKKKQTDFLKAEDERLSDFQRALWKADTGVFRVEAEEQARIKKDQTDELSALDRKISDYQKSIWQVIRNQSDAAAEDAKTKAKDMAAAAKLATAAWVNAIENLNTRLAESFAGMIVNAKFSFESLVNIAKQTAQNMLSAFLSGLERPLTSALAGLGVQLGGVLGGVFGGGGGVPHLPGGAAGPVLGTTVAAGGISSASLLAFATNPITIGVAAAAAVGLAIKHFVGQGRRAADQFGESVQVPFGSALSGIINPFNALRSAGRLTLETATKAYDGLTELWSSFVASANQFATQGKDQAKVVAQAFATMTTNFGPDLKNLFDSIGSAIDELSAQAEATKITTAPVLAGIPETGRALSASSIFADAVQVFKGSIERFVSGGSGASGPPISITVESAPQISISVASSSMAFEVRDRILPEILKDLNLDMNQVATTLIQILKGKWDGVVQTGGAVA